MRGLNKALWYLLLNGLTAIRSVYGSLYVSFAIDHINRQELKAL